MKLFPAVALILALSAARALAQNQPLPSTSFTRTLLRSPDVATAQQILQIGSTNTIPPGVLTNNDSRAVVFNNSLQVSNGIAFRTNFVLTPSGSGSLLTVAGVPLIIFQSNSVLLGTSVIASGGDYSGGGSGLSNAVDLIPGSNITITTNANKRSFTIAATGGGGGAVAPGTGGVSVTTNGQLYTVSVSGGGGGSNSFPLTDSTILATNYDGLRERGITYIENWNSTSNQALEFNMNSTKAVLFQNDLGQMHFNNYGSGQEFEFDQSLRVDGQLSISGGLQVTNLTAIPVTFPFFSVYWDYPSGYLYAGLTASFGGLTNASGKTADEFSVRTNAQFYGTTTVSTLLGNVGQATNNLGRTMDASVSTNETRDVSFSNFTAANATLTNVNIGAFRLSTNSWSGPTNALDMSLADQTYITSTAVYLTNISNWFLTNSLYVKLTVSNSSASTVEFRLPAQWRTDDGLRVYYVTNAQIRECWVNAKNGMTNCITTVLY